MKIKHLLLAFFLVSVIFKSYGQKFAVVAPTKNNFLYAGLENPLAIAVPGVDANSILVKAENGHIEKVGDVNYSIVPDPGFRQATIEVFSVNNENDTVSHGKALFRVLQIPMPDLFLCNQKIHQSDTISIRKGELRAMPILEYRHENFDYEVLTNIVSFAISFKKENELIKRAVKGYKIPVDIINELISISEPTKVVLENIRYKSAGSEKAFEDTGRSFYLKWSN